MQQHLISITFSSRDTALELHCMARCIEPAVWTEMLWLQLLTIWLMWGKLCYSYWSFDHGRVGLVFVSIKTDCNEMKFSGSWKEMIGAISIYCSSTQPAGKLYTGTQVILIFSSPRKYRTKCDLLWVQHYWFGWDLQGRILSDKTNRAWILCTDSLWAVFCTEIAGNDLRTRQGALKGYSSSGQGDVSYPLKIEQVLLKGLPGLCLLTLVYNIRILFVPTAFVVLAAVSLPVSQTHPAEVCRKQWKPHCDAQEKTPPRKKSFRRHSPSVLRYFC